MNLRLLKLCLCLLCIIYPILIGIFVGTQKGLSLLSVGYFEPLYIFVNACTSYFFFGYNKWTWKTMSASLLLLTCFNCHIYPFLHNVFAVIFFLAVVWELKNLRVLIMALMFLIFGNIFLFESYLIIILAIHNLKLLKRFG